MSARSAEWMRCNRAIRAVAKAGGLSEDDRRAVMRRAVGKDSLGDCSDREMATVLAALNRSAPAPSIRTPWRKSAKGYIRKIYVLWREAGQSGAIEHADRKALLAWVRRMTQSDQRPEGIVDLRQLEWLSYAEAEPIIEGLKAMIARVGGKIGEKIGETGR